MSSALDQLLLAETKGRRATNAESQQGTIDAPERLQRQAQRVNTFVDPGGPNVDRAGIAQLTAGLEKFSRGVDRGTDAVIQGWAKQETENALAGFSASGAANLTEYEQMLASGDDPATLGRVARNSLEAVSGQRRAEEAAAEIKNMIDAGELNGLDPAEASARIAELWSEAAEDVPEGELFYFSTVQAQTSSRLLVEQTAASNEFTFQESVAAIVKDGMDGDGSFTEQSMIALQAAVGLRGAEATGAQVATNIAATIANRALEDGGSSLPLAAQVEDVVSEVEAFMSDAGYDYDVSVLTENAIRQTLSKGMAAGLQQSKIAEANTLKQIQDVIANNPELSAEEVQNKVQGARLWDIVYAQNQFGQMADPFEMGRRSLDDGETVTAPDQLSTVAAGAKINLDKDFGDLSKGLGTRLQGHAKQLDALLNGSAPVKNAEIFLQALQVQDPEGYRDLATFISYKAMDPEQQALMEQNLTKLNGADWWASERNPLAVDNFARKKNPKFRSDWRALTDDDTGIQDTMGRTIKGWFGAKSDREILDEFVSEINAITEPAELQQMFIDIHQEESFSEGRTSGRNPVGLYNQSLMLSTISKRLEELGTPMPARWLPVNPGQVRVVGDPDINSDAQLYARMDEWQAEQGKRTWKNYRTHTFSSHEMGDLTENARTPLIDDILKTSHYGTTDENILYSRMFGDGRKVIDADALAEILEQAK